MLYEKTIFVVVSFYDVEKHYYTIVYLVICIHNTGKLIPGQHRVMKAVEGNQMLIINHNNGNLMNISLEKKV